MFEQSPSSAELTTNELFLEETLQNDESILIATHDNFDYGMKAVLSHVELIIRGEGESLEENAAYVEMLINEVSTSFSEIISAADSDDEILSHAAIFIHKAITEIVAYIDSLQLDIATHQVSVDEVKEYLEIELSDQDEEEKVQNIETIFESHLIHAIQTTVEYAKDNKNDLRKEKIQLWKDRFRGGATDTVKIALGALTAVAISHLLDRRNT